MKTKFILIATLCALILPSFAQAGKKVTNRQFPDGTGSSKSLDSEKRESIETVYDTAGRMVYRIRYKLDHRMQLVSGIYYNKLGKIFQKSAYRLDPQDRIIQEVVYDSKDRLVCTKNYEYGVRTQWVQGRPTQSTFVERVSVYDSQGRLKTTTQTGKKGSKR